MTQPPSTNTVPAVVNVAARMTAAAESDPDRLAVVVAKRLGRQGVRLYDKITFRQLNQNSDRIAAALGEMGVQRGTRLALLAPNGMEFVTLVFALLKAGAVAVLVDPGMGKRNLIHCLEQVEPEGFVAVPLAQAIRIVLRRRFPKARFNVTVGRRWFWSGATLDDCLARECASHELAATRPDEPAAIIFTSGSTGPPKGVEFTHQVFDTQVVEIRDRYSIEPGGVDLACFPLFGLFNAAMGITTVVPDMDASRPATADPASLVSAIFDWRVTQSFASPAVWRLVGEYCQAFGIRLPTLRHVFSAGAPVSPQVLEQMQACIGVDGEGDVFTPYGATEALPVASIAAREVLSETRAAWARGLGTCVGRRFARIDWRIIGIIDGPIASIAETEPLPEGQIGELIVRGPVVTRRYVTRTEFNALAKIADGDGFWHRMGDVGYIDDQERFWFCGRLSQRVVSETATMFTEPCEAIYNQHPAIARSALVGVGPRGRQRPVIICQPHEMPVTRGSRKQLVEQLRLLGKRNPLTAPIDEILLHDSFPVDVRHNAKIFREKLAVWAARRIGRPAHA